MVHGLQLWLLQCLCWLLLLFPTISGALHHDATRNLAPAALLTEASELLAVAGATGLCHPTTNDFAPWFPKCINPDSRSRARIRNDTQQQAPEPDRIGRRLENVNNDDENDGGDNNNDDDDNNNNLQYYEYYQKDDNDDNKNDDDDGTSTNNWASTTTSSSSRSNFEGEFHHHPPSFFIFNATLTVVCVIVGSISSGLYIGLMSMDPLLLVIKSRTSKSEREKHRIEQLLALIKQRHQLIVTLLITSCLAAEAMPVFLQRLVHDYLAILVSVILALFFSEILPSVLFTGVNQIEMASQWAPAVRIWICILYPITYPFARILEVLSSPAGGSAAVACCGSDHHHHRHPSSSSAGGGAAGDDRHLGVSAVGGTLYNRGELAALIRIQYEERRARRQQNRMQKQSSQESIRNNSDNTLPFDSADFSTHSLHTVSPTASIDLRNFNKRDFQRRGSMASLDSHDVERIEGALQLKTKTAMDICLSWHKVFCIPADMQLDDANIFTIYASGYSRVPVYVNNDRKQVQGILLTRHLMVINQKKKRDEDQLPTPPDLALHRPRCVPPDTNLSDLISLFQSGSSAVQAGHMALVCVRPHVGNKALEQGEAIPDKAGLMGVCTLEDVLEALLQQQIYDEMDLSGRNPRSGTPNNDAMDTIKEADSYHPMA